MTDTYKETIHRYRIIRHDELPEAHKAEYRLNGIDPDDNWTLVWSFRTEEAAFAQLADCVARKGKFQTFRLVDAGQEEVVERQAWF